ncbi:MAG TPA: flavin reductase family protein, partial [Chloroflexota bacterium]
GARHGERPREEASHMGREILAVEDRAAMPAVDAGQFKSALASFATGVTLATTLAAGEPHGVTANAIMSVSLEPPLVALSIQQGTRMHAALQRADNFALSVLAAEQVEVARYFSDSTQPHDAAAFTLFPSRAAITGAPLLDQALAHVDCRIVEAHPAGDHTLYLGRVVYSAIRPDGEPLLYFRKRFLE